MKKFWNFIYKYRILILLVILLALGIFGFIFVKNYLYPDDEKTVYGSRLDGIEEVVITESKKKEVIDFIKENEFITNVTFDIQGKIINIYITSTSEENTSDKLKELSTLALEKFSDKEIAFYDFQFFIKNEESNYNMIGYKNKKSTLISWSVDEIVSSEVENEEEEK